MWELFWALLAVIAVLFSAYLFTKYVAGRPGGLVHFQKGRMAVLDQIPIGREQTLLLVALGNYVYLLGVAQGSVTRLERFSEQEWAELEENMLEHADDAPKPVFQESLKKMLEQRRNRGGRD